jgi:predicted DNA-binding protein
LGDNSQVPKRNKVKVSTYVHPAQMAALKKLSAKTGVPMAAMVREGIDLAIKKFRKRR